MFKFMKQKAFSAETRQHSEVTGHFHNGHTTILSDAGATGSTHEAQQEVYSKWLGAGVWKGVGCEG